MFVRVVQVRPDEGVAVCVGVVTTPTQTATPSSGLTWTTRTNMPTARGQMGTAVASNGKIYVVGGQANGVALATVEEYDPSTDTWATKASLPRARWQIAVVAAPDG